MPEWEGGEGREVFCLGLRMQTLHTLSLSLFTQATSLLVLDQRRLTLT